MSKKVIGTGITRLLFGLKGKDLKVIPYNEMSPQQFEQLDSFLGKLGFILSSNEYTLTKQQSNYVKIKSTIRSLQKRLCQVKT